MQQGLALPRAAVEVALAAVLADLRDVPAHRLPAPDLALARPGTGGPCSSGSTTGTSRAGRPWWIQPFCRQSDSGWEAFTPKKLRLGSCALRREPGVREPGRRELVAAIGHVLAAEDAQFQHLLGRQLGRKSGCEAAAGGRGEGCTEYPRCIMSFTTTSITGLAPCRPRGVGATG